MKRSKKELSEARGKEKEEYVGVKQRCEGKLNSHVSYWFYIFGKIIREVNITHEVL